MARERIVYKDEPAVAPEVHEAPAEQEEFESVHEAGAEYTPIPETEEDFDARVTERRRRTKKKRIRKKTLTIIVMVLAFAFLATMCGKDIVRLKAENRALKKQQAALQKERDELKAELENTSEQEYIRDQARRQLRLLNPGELLFIFDD